MANGNLRVPLRAESPDGAVGDGMLEIGPDHPQFEAWMRWLDKQKDAGNRDRPTVEQ